MNEYNFSNKQITEIIILVILIEKSKENSFGRLILLTKLIEIISKQILEKQKREQNEKAQAETK